MSRLRTRARAAEIPSRPHDAWGNPRRVGVEIEFGGLTLDETVQCVLDHCGGSTVESPSPVERIVETKLLGTIRLEIDDHALKELSRKDEVSGALNFWETQEQRMRSAAAGWIVPVELVTQPLPIRRLRVLDSLVTALARAGACGSGESLLYAFGVHFNPTAYTTDAGELRDLLLAFAFLDPWLRDELGVDLTRRVLPFVDPYSDEYIHRLLSSSRELTLERLIEDYIVDNPTRDRALDMLPLFHELRPGLVRNETKEDELVKPRPTFHYRLTDSRLGERDWNIEHGWRLWLIVEDLAQDVDRLEGMSREFLRTGGGMSFADRVEWARGWLTL